MMRRWIVSPVLTGLFVACFLAINLLNFKVGAQTPQPVPTLGVEQVKADLAKLDQGLFSATASESASGKSRPGELDTSELKTASLRARDVYRQYIIRAEKISHDLIEIRDRIQPKSNGEKTAASGETRLSLQQLGALAQHLSAQNKRFKDTFLHGEDQFQSYQHIQKAITNLEDAIYYWRSANKFRELYRETAIEKFEDDDVLKLKIRTALNAIDELEEVLKIRGALNQLEY